MVAGATAAVAAQSRSQGLQLAQGSALREAKEVAVVRVYPDRGTALVPGSQKGAQPPHDFAPALIA